MAENKTELNQSLAGKVIRASDLSAYGQNLSRFDFTDSKFDGQQGQKDLPHYTFDGSVFLETTCQNVTFARSTFQKASLVAVTIGENTSFEGCNFQGASIQDTTFGNTNMSNTVFDASKLRRVDFNNTSLKDANFTSARLTDVKFGKNTDLTGARFTNATLKNVDFTDANIPIENIMKWTFSGADIDFETVKFPSQEHMERVKRFQEEERKEAEYNALLGIGSTDIDTTQRQANVSSDLSDRMQQVETPNSQETDLKAAPDFETRKQLNDYIETGEMPPEEPPSTLWKNIGIGGVSGLSVGVVVGVWAFLALFFMASPIGIAILGGVAAVVGITMLGGAIGALVDAFITSEPKPPVLKVSVSSEGAKRYEQSMLEAGKGSEMKLSGGTYSDTTDRLGGSVNENTTVRESINSVTRDTGETNKANPEFEEPIIINSTNTTPESGQTNQVQTDQVVPQQQPPQKEPVKQPISDGIKLT